MSGTGSVTSGAVAGRGDQTNQSSQGFVSGFRGDATVAETWTALAANPAAFLVDVRTKPEWSFVGLPDLSQLGKEPALIEWQIYPSMELNGGFLTAATALADEIAAASGQPAELYFLCRSGVRSRAAAISLAETAAASGAILATYNIAHGFEGPLDDAGRRGAAGGWKAAGLAWRQS